VILIIDIYSCQTDPEERAFQKQWPEVNPKVWTDYTLLNGCTERCGHFFDISQKGIDIQKILNYPFTILN
jgi:hypothetical protein